MEIRANNVTIQDCTFAAPAGYRSVQVDAGFYGTTVTHDTFDSGLVPNGAAAWVTSVGQITVTGNMFIGTPGDAVDLSSGTVSGNYFSGVGYSSSGTHADAVWVTDLQGPVTISNNFIDWTPDGSQSLVNNAVRITAEMGSASNVTVNGNFLVGGSYTVDAGNAGSKGTFSNISITNNYLGFGAYGAFFPGAQSGVTASGNVIFDYSNPIYSTQAWAAYQAAGIQTTNLLISTGANIGSPSSTGSVTLYSGGYDWLHMYGGLGENNFVGGSGVQYLHGGPGANIFTYLSPSDSTVNAPDMVGNFDSAKDVIDLSHIDASLAAAGVQGFTFIGTAPFSGGGAQVRYVQDPAHNITYVEADLAGNSKPDLFIRVSGLQTLTAANFALTAAQSNAALAAGVSGSALAPTISGTTSGQTTTSEAPVHPFANVTVADPNASATETLTITVGGAGGTLTGTGLTGGSGGVYTLSGTATAITGALNALSFTPTAGVPNTVSTSTFTLSDASSAYGAPTVDSATSITDIDPAVAPTISGTTSGQTTTSEAPVHPFASVTVADPNASATETLTITVGGAGGTLTGTGLTGGSGGVYTLSGTATAITGALNALSFTPTAGAPNTVSTSTFTLSDASSAYGAPTVDTATSITDIDPAVGTASDQAWAAYLAAGIPTSNLIISTGANIGSSSSTGSVTLYGGGYSVVMIGGHGENNFVGGASAQTMLGGVGANIFTYLSPSDSTVNTRDMVGYFDSAKDVIDLSHIDASLAAAGVQNFTFIGTAPFSGGGAQVRYVQDPAHNITYVEADLAGNSTPDLFIRVAGLQTLTAANFALTAAQSNADMANGAALSVSLKARVGNVFDYSYQNVAGEPYSSYDAIVTNGSQADNLYLSSTSNDLVLKGSNLTITRGSGAESITVGTSVLSLAYHANETIDASASGAQTFAFGANFGDETINGFTGSGANADTINLALSSFSYLSSGMTQAQDLAAVLANATTSASGTTIHDSKGDSMTLAGFTPTMITAAASQFHFA